MQTDIPLLYGTDSRYRLDEVFHQVAGGKAVLLDVRELDEWTDSHLEHAKPFPLSELRGGRAPDDDLKGQKIYLHCRSGLRVWAAGMILQNLGFKEVIPLEENLQELKSWGF